HPFRTLDGWTPLDQLSAGQCIAVPRRVPAPALSRSWDEDELVLLAHLLGDGSIGPSVKYATADPANKQIVTEAARRRFGIEVQGGKLGIAQHVEGSALSALAASDVLWDEIVEITDLGSMPTFDATVEGDHNF